MGDVTHPMGDHESPRRVCRRRDASGGDGDQPVLVTVQEQHRHGDVPQHRRVLPPPGKDPHQRARGHDELTVDVLVALAHPGQLEVLLDDGARDSRGATQHSRRTASATSSADLDERRRATILRPTAGTAYRRNIAATNGPGREDSPTGSAGSMRTTPATASGWAEVCSTAMSPPIEFPTRMAGSPHTSVMKRSRRRWLSVTDVDRPWLRVRPNPERIISYWFEVPELGPDQAGHLRHGLGRCCPNRSGAGG